MKLKPFALSAAFLLLTAGTVIAQPTPPPGDMPGPHGAMAHHDPAVMAKQHADKLRTALQLTSAQEPALNALVASMKPPAGMEKRQADRQAMANLSTPQRLDQMLAKMDQHRARMGEHAAAVKRFYAQLTPPQQKAFDAMHADGRGRMGGHRMGGKGMMPGHPG